MSTTSEAPLKEDLEKGASIDEQEKRERPSESTSDSLETSNSNEEKIITVDWNGEDDLDNPINWPFARKWAATAIVSAFTFISPLSSSMLAPVSEKIAQEFGITSQVIVAMCTSVFVLAYAFGPLFLGPLSELYGRSHVLQLANLVFLIFNLACGFSRNTAELIVFRFLSGIGGSAPLAVGGGVLGDVWRAEERGMAIALYSLAPLLGPAIGPVVGAWIGLRTTWRWVLWAVTIADGFVQLAGIFFLQETYAPVLLERKAKQLRKDMGLSKEDGERRVRTPFEDGSRHWKNIFARALTRPFVMFFTEPIVSLLGVYQAFVYGMMYLMLTTLPTIFASPPYSESIGIAGLHYIALGIGFTFASQFNARFIDFIYKYLKKRNDGIGKPEFRLPSMLFGTLALPFGLFLFGWTAEKHLHWIAIDFGSAIVAAGVILNFQAIQTYVIDAFTLHAASALAATAFLRSLCGFGFPLFAPDMFNKLGYGVGCSILGATAIAIGVPSPYIFWTFGERLRMRSRHSPTTEPPGR